MEAVLIAFLRGNEITNKLQSPFIGLFVTWHEGLVQAFKSRQFWHKSGVVKVCDSSMTSTDSFIKMKLPTLLSCSGNPERR